ncbi:MAG: class I SAM-dependent methyltransferase [Bacteroidales bacterium]|nr:class I SAM-dependent methyltransferase [Bacteroidales bacterium]
MSVKCPFCESENTRLYLHLKDYFLTQEDFEIYECDDCKLLFTTPRPDATAIGKYYKSEDYLSHNEHKKGLVPWIYNHVKKINIKNKYKMVCKVLHHPKSGIQNFTELLDFGCGVGDFLHYAQQKGCEVMGCDMSEDARRIASEKLGKPVVTPEEIFALPYSTFDVITMWHVLEHIDNLKFQVNQLHRLLKDNGRLVIAVPNYMSYDAQYYKDKWAAYDVPRHLNHFHKESLQNIFAGKFQLKEIYPMKWDAFYISMMSEKFLGHKNSFLRGIRTGLKSNRKARKSGDFSSLIYIFDKI